MAVEIIQGEKQTVNINVKSKLTGQPFDFTGATEIVICFKSSSVVIQKKLTDTDVSVVGDPKLGQLTTALQVADTDSLPVTQNGHIEIVETKAVGEVSKAQILDGFTVLAKICP